MKRKLIGRRRRAAHDLTWEETPTERNQRTAVLCELDRILTAIEHMRLDGEYRVPVHLHPLLRHHGVPSSLFILVDPKSLDKIYDMVLTKQEAYMLRPQRSSAIDGK